MLVSMSALEPTNCPICEHNQTAFLFRKDDLNIVSCNQCRLIFVNPRVPAPVLAGDYISHYYPSEKRTQLVADPMEWAQMTERLAEVTAKTAGRRLLDLGCGMGTFLHLAKSAGWETCGVDLSQTGCQYAREHYDLSVFCGDLFEANFPDAHFDVITLFHVLEHIPDPNPLLTEIRRILKPRIGKLVVEVPNGGSIQMKMQRENWPYVHPKDHLYYFSCQSLTDLLQKNRFDQIEVGKPRRVNVGKGTIGLIRFAIQKQISDLLVRFNLATVIRLYASCTRPINLL